MIAELLRFENPESLAIGAAVLLFIVIMAVLKKIKFHRGVSIIIAFVISSITAWNLYQERFYGWEGILAVLLIIAVLGILLRIFWAFFRGSRRGFRR